MADCSPLGAVLAAHQGLGLRSNLAESNEAAAPTWGAGRDQFVMQCRLQHFVISDGIGTLARPGDPSTVAAFFCHYTPKFAHLSGARTRGTQLSGTSRKRVSDGAHGRGQPQPRSLPGTQPVS